MYPRSLLEDEVKSRAEGRVFEALRDQLDDEWEVFHSASLVIRDHATGAEDDECDFVLCHPDRGIVCLEVKGGGIECEFGEWRRLRKDGPAERIKDPFTQALDHRYNLSRKIEEVEGYRRHKLFLVHALAFPDISAHSLVLAPDAPADLVMGRTDLPDMTAAIDRALAYHEGSRDKRTAPGAEGAAMLRELLAPRVRIEVPMATTFLDETEELVLLTHEQSALLNRFGRARRMVVYGCAGSGKTMLAVERAKRLADEGQRVLFVCFNRGLREHLNTREGRDNLTFQTFHSVCVYWARRAKIPLKDYPSGTTPPPEHWREDLPYALIEAMEQLGGQFDAVLVDEAQDLHTDWLDALNTTIADPAAGSLWLFLDDNQRIYDTTLDVTDDYVPFDLTVNCRNTQLIHREVMKLYQGQIVPEARGPEGRSPELLLAKDQPATVASVLERLCSTDEIPPQDIVVLSSHASAKSAVAREGHGRFTFTDKRGAGGSHVHFSSIRAFKGLESPVVVLCELEDLDAASHDQQLYVALSRARNHVVIVGPG
ncbi:DNA helicase [Paraconexibacter sp. AEG42_29]|uniref:DNA helicase n=2 Tax=Paraconexibacter sp. AEG42_29 TaxID=2997339 RepID=A0AAU7B1N8_9ACTN